jgi:cytochrome P450
MYLEPKWKFLRSIITPNFASHRIRDMSQCLQELAKEHTSNLKSKINEEKVAIEFRSFVSTLITKTIEKCYCGVHLENRVDPSNTFDILMKKLLGEFTGYDIKHELVRKLHNP